MSLSLHFEQRGFYGALFATILSGYAFRKGSLTTSGCVAAWLVGFCTYVASGWHVAVLLMFFFGGTKLTKVGHKKKEKLEEGYCAQGGRNHWQVLANGGLGTLLSLMWVMDKSNSCLLVAYLVQYSVVAGDTWASELGILNTSNPRLIIGFREVPPGTNGGITLLGTAASLLGGLSIGSISFTVSPPMMLATHPIIVSGIGGLLGSAVDSILGQFFEYSGTTTTGIVTNNPSSDKAVKVPGTWLAILNGNQINFLAAFLTTVFLSYTMC
eukprot:TRINITY_DN24863_c0_g1_i1.p1 TRINITY_DN24863_c0_g1~~TRINITY_DN24863_c0_g1_i1.p1  ORF type:complete len:269 (+),score=42.91 TRINITY_DN24863_c0_g1_i1:41-847(+)